MPFLPEPASTPQQISVITALPVILTIVFFSVYWLLASSGRLKERIYNNFNTLTANVLYVIAKRVAGFVLLGVLPLVILLLPANNTTLERVGLGFNQGTGRFAIISILLMSLLIIPVVSYGARKPAIFELYPEIRVSRWTGGLIFTEMMTWAVYLLGYEVLFRGVLLFGLAGSLGPVPAVAINVIMYSAAHIPKGKTEALAAIPFGLVLCILTLHSGAIWIAFIVHVINAFAMTLAAIRANPGMSYTLEGEKASAS